MAGLFDAIFGPVPEEKKPVGKPGLLRPSFVKRPSTNVEQWFDVTALWNHVKTQYKSASRSGKAEIPVVQITHPGIDEGRAASETAYFFSKQKDIAGMDSRTAWDRVLGPFLDEVEEVLNAHKPKDLEGILKFDVAPDSSLTLFYVER